MTWLTRLGRRAAGPIGLVVALVLLAAPAALASTPFADIHSAGPLSDIYIGNDLSCQVKDGGFSSTEFYPNASGPGDCGTFLFVNGDGNSAFFGPDFTNHAGGTHTTGNFADTEVPFTPVSQSQTGSGTTASPYQVTTIVSGVDESLSLTFTEVDTYVVGSNSFRTEVTVSNTSAGASFSGELYHAADCQLRGNDNGFGAYEPSEASPDTAACTPTLLGNPPSALEEFNPITTGGSWEENTSAAIWSHLDSEVLLDECDQCRTSVDNGAALEWPISLPAGDSRWVLFATEIAATVLSE